MMFISAAVDALMEVMSYGRGCLVENRAAADLTHDSTLFSIVNIKSGTCSENLLGHLIKTWNICRINDRSLLLGPSERMFGRNQIGNDFVFCFLCGALLNSNQPCRSSLP